MTPRSGDRPSEKQPEVERVLRLLLFLSREVPGGMRLCAGQSSVELAFLSRLGAACRATYKQGWVLPGFHGYMMQVCPEISLVNCDHCTHITTQHSRVV